MELKRNAGFFTALKYKGQGPMLTFILHRIGGLGMGVFVTTHILASFLSGDVGNLINGIYEHWLFQIFIFFCALFHGINGLRITLLDLFPSLIPHQREAIWVEWAVFIPVFGFAAFAILTTALGS